MQRYAMSWAAGSERKYSKDFINTLRSLCNEKDLSKVYSKFVRQYGTHIFDTVRVGAKSTVNIYGSSKQSDYDFKSTVSNVKSFGLKYYNIGGNLEMKEQNSNSHSDSYST